MGILKLAMDLIGRRCAKCDTPLNIDNVAKKDNGETLLYNNESTCCSSCEAKKDGKLLSMPVRAGA